MKKDPIETLYTQTFSQTKPMDYDNMLKGVQEKMKTKPSRFRKKGFIALLAASFLLLSTVVAAQVLSSNAFERLTEVIGEAEASQLQFLGLTNFDMYDEYRVGSTTTPDGILVELIAVGVEDDELDIFLLLKDTTGTREWCDLTWEGMPTIHHTINFTDPVLGADWWRSRGESVNFNAIDHDGESGAVLLHSRMSRPSLAYGTNIGDANVRDLTFNLVDIIYGFNRIEDQAIPVNLAELLENPSPSWVIPKDDFGYFGIGGAFTLGVGQRFLEAGHMNIDIDAAGRPMQITGVGIIENRLHIQTYSNGNGSIMPFLINPNGERVNDIGVISYNLDENGNFMRSHGEDENGNHVSYGLGRYMERAFIIDPARISEYRLYGDVFHFGYIAVNWAVSFELQGGSDLPALRPPAPRLDGSIMRVTGPSFHDVANNREVAELLGITPGDTSRGISISFHPDGELPQASFTNHQGVIVVLNDFDNLPPILVDYIMAQWEFLRSIR